MIDQNVPGKKKPPDTKGNLLYAQGISVFYGMSTFFYASSTNRVSRGRDLTGLIVRMRDDSHPDTTQPITGDQSK